MQTSWKKVRSFPIVCGAYLAKPESYCNVTGQENIKLGAGGKQTANKTPKIVFFVVRTDGVSTSFGHNTEGPTETACPWLVALDCFPWRLYQASKVTIKNSCFAQIVANLMSFSSRRNPLSVEKSGCSRNVISKAYCVVQDTSP